MKIYLKYFAFVLAFGLMSCEKNFESINTNPNATAVASAEYLFTNSQLTAINNNYYFTNILNCGGFIQHYATYKVVSGVGDKYLANDFYQAPFYTDAYLNSVNQISLVINNTSDVNKKSIARIWKVYIMHRITDLYGDVPYNEAGKGASGLIFTPKYDTQSAIYADMLKELDEAVKALDNTKASFGNADLIYQGNVDKWKKFGNSLMLRLGLRMSNVDPTNAKMWVAKAQAGGVILANADEAVLKYTDGPQNYNRNPSAYEARTRDFVSGANGRTNIEGSKFSKTFIDHLIKTNDPRLNVISGVWVSGVQKTETALQKGFVNGTDQVPSPDVLGTYSEPNQSTIFKMDAPLVILGAAETQLYLAEAAVKGYISLSADELYSNAVKASLQGYSRFGTGNIITTEAITAYNTANALPTGSAEQKLEAIGTQLWVALFLDEIEVYSNYRRTGFPKLTPVNYAANNSNSQIPRRLIYPSVEQASNKANYQTAIGKQGADTFTTKVWWDK